MAVAARVIKDLIALPFGVDEPVTNEPVIAGKDDDGTESRSFQKRSHQNPVAATKDGPHALARHFEMKGS